VAVPEHPVAVSVEPVTRRAPRRPSPTVLRMRWRLLTYVHWRVEPAVVRAALPPGLEADTFDGSAWVGLIPFHMRDVRLPGMPPLPYVGDFPETNVRTYTVGPDGRRGVYFHSLEASRLGAVVVARALFGLPYQWASMRVTTSPGRIRYVGRRRWREHAGARSDLAVRVGRRLPADEVTALDDFLSARWAFHDTSRTGVPVAATVDHEQWPLHEASVEHLRDELVAAAGYGDLATRPPDHVRFSPGVDVRAGFPTIAA
jgi:uncharacterized protein YqjF (DUF2071 family)